MRKKIIIIAIIVLIFIAALNAFEIKPRKLNKNMDLEHISIFIPNGMANKYHDYMVFSFDDRRIWEYRLNENEINAIEEELDNGIWKKATEEEYEDIIGVFFGLDPNIVIPDNLTKDIYYCLFDDDLDEFIYTDSDVAILGWHRDVFIYDITHKTYWCVAMGI